MNIMRKVMLTGDRPTGRLHVGHYVGSLRRRVELYRADTCTNVFPSLHVFNTLSVCIAVHESEKLKKHKAVCNAAYILAALIILATMFLKQHSVLDVFGAVIMAYVLYKVVYEPEKKMIPQLSKQKFSKQKRIAAHNK